MINFNLPGMYETYQLNKLTIEQLNKQPEIFNKNITIHACYGNFQFCSWEGGRTFTNFKTHQALKKDIEEIFNFYNSYNIAVRLVFTNQLLTKENYNSRFENLILAIGNNGLNEIVINNEGLEEYIRNKYNKYNFISSTTKRITNLEQSLNEIKKAQYKFICLDYDLNSNIDFLKQIPLNLKNKIELLCNAICIPNCPNRINHYKINSEYALSYGKPYTLNCKAIKSVNSPEVIAYKNTVTLDNIYNLYYPLGIEQYKLEGRSLNYIDNICTYARYLLLPEYQYDFIEHCVTDILGVTDERQILLCNTCNN